MHRLTNLPRLLVWLFICSFLLTGALGWNPSPAQALPADYPPDPTENISWNAGTAGVADVQAAFNNARTQENAQLGTNLPMLTLPSQSEWDALSDSEKALWLINAERVDRGVLRLQAVESNVLSVAEYYAHYLLDNDVWGHDKDGHSPWERLETNPAIAGCHDWIGVAENLAVFVASYEPIPLPLERSVYSWMYNDGDSWGHRHAILYYPYTNNSGPTGAEGFIGIGRATGGPYKGPFAGPWDHAEIVVMNVFDPCASWDYGYPVMDHWTFLPFMLRNSTP